MARDFGYGGIANTNGPRSFAGKEAAAAPAAVATNAIYLSRYSQSGRRRMSRSFVTPLVVMLRAWR